MPTEYDEKGRAKWKVREPAQVEIFIDFQPARWQQCGTAPEHRYHHRVVLYGTKYTRAIPRFSVELWEIYGELEGTSSTRPLRKEMIDAIQGAAEAKLGTRVIGLTLGKLERL